MNITRHSQEFKELVSRLQSGELTRKQAAEVYGVNFGTLSSWLLRAKVNDITRLKEKPLYGSAVKMVANMDPIKAKLLEEAVSKVIDGTFSSCLSAQKAYPEVSLSTLTTRVRKLREAAKQLQTA